jgi:7-cyano-7-deazaguanine reductase
VQSAQHGRRVELYLQSIEEIYPLLKRASLNLENPKRQEIKMDLTRDLTILGQTVAEPTGKIECFENPNCDRVVFETDEITSVCPRTGQPDFHCARIEYVPDKLCIESKSLKLAFWLLRNRGAFIEQLSRDICDDLFEACQPKSMTVTLKMKPRGGISIEASTTRVQK